MLSTYISFFSSKNEVLTPYKEKCLLFWSPERTSTLMKHTHNCSLVRSLYPYPYRYGTLPFFGEVLMNSQIEQCINTREVRLGTHWTCSSQRPCVSARRLLSNNLWAEAGKTFQTTAKFDLPPIREVVFLHIVWKPDPQVCFRYGFLTTSSAFLDFNTMDNHA